MSAKSAKQFGIFEATSKGKLKGMGGPSAAKEFHNKTSKSKKSSFAKALARRK